MILVIVKQPIKMVLRDKEILIEMIKFHVPKMLAERKKKKKKKKKSYETEAVLDRVSWGGGVEWM